MVLHMEFETNIDQNTLTSDEYLKRIDANRVQVKVLISMLAIDYQMKMELFNLADAMGLDALRLKGATKYEEREELNTSLKKLVKCVGL